MIRTFRYPLRPTKKQEATLDGWRRTCASLYNTALQERRDAWSKASKSVTRYDQHKSLTIVRAEIPEIAEVPLLVLRSPLNRLDNAFKAFFRRCKAGETPGYPRFRSARRYDSFSIGRVKVGGKHVYVPKLGPVRFHRYRDLKGTVRDCSIGREAAGGWYVADRVHNAAQNVLALGLSAVDFTAEAYV